MPLVDATLVEIDNSSPLTVTLDASQSQTVNIAAFPHIVKVQDPYDVALRSGMAFSAGTGVQRIASRKLLNMMFRNPPDSGKNAFVVLRVVGCNRTLRDGPIEAGFVNNAVDLTDATQVTPSNLKTGGAASSMEFFWNTSTDRINTDPPQIGDPLGFMVPAGGDPYKIETTRIVGPGESAGIFVRGEGAADNDHAFISFVWFEEDA